jgi:hypothetical protein
MIIALPVEISLIGTELVRYKLGISGDRSSATVSVSHNADTIAARLQAEMASRDRCAKPVGAAARFGARSMGAQLPLGTPKIGARE